MVSLRRRQLCCGGVATLVGSLLPSSQVLCATLPYCRYSLVDGWASWGPKEYITHRAGSNDRSGVPQVVEKIKEKLSFSTNFDVLIAKGEDNAFATVANGKKILVVDVGFLVKLNRISGTEWGAIQVIAHEIGHHIAGFNVDSHRSELTADYWSGQSLQRLGAAKSAATSAIRAVGTDFDTPTHPNKSRRAATIERGWNDAYRGYVDYAFCDDCR